MSSFSLSLFFFGSHPPTSAEFPSIKLFREFFFQQNFPEIFPKKVPIRPALLLATQDLLCTDSIPLDGRP